MKKMNNHPFLVTVINGILHACRLDETGFPSQSAGSLDWRPVIKEVDQSFLDDAREVLGTAFDLFHVDINDDI